MLTKMADARHVISPCDTLMREAGLKATLCSFMLVLSSLDLDQMKRYPDVGLLWHSHFTLENAPD
jgi:hypothetical protein